MTRSLALRSLLAAAALFAALGANAQGTAKKDLVQRILQAQQSELEAVSRSIAERPAAQMMQDAGMALQRQVPADKREAMGKAIEAEVRKYVDESYPLVRERALKAAPSTIGATLEEKMSEDELRQVAAWLESPVNKKFQQLGPEMRNAFIQRVLADAGPVVDPKVRALDARIRVILGLPPPAPAASPASGAASATAAKAAASRAKATGK